MTTPMNEQPDNESPKGISSAWWRKYVVSLLIGLCVGIGGYFVASALVGNSAPQQAASSTASTPEVSTASTPEASTASTPEASTASKPKKADSKNTTSAAKPALEKKFCSKPSGVCFNYPKEFKVYTETFPSREDEKDHFFKTAIIGPDDKVLMDFFDGKRYVEEYFCEDDIYKDNPPMQIIESAPTHWKIKDENDKTVTVYAVKLVEGFIDEDSNKLSYTPEIHLTIHKELLKPGKVSHSCRLNDKSSLYVGENTASMDKNEYPEGLTFFTDPKKSQDGDTYPSFDEAAQQLKTKPYKIAWDIIRSVRNK